MRLKPQVVLVAPQLVENGVVGRGEQVAFQGRVFAQLLALFPYFQETVLHNLLGLYPRLEVAVGKTVHQRAVMPEQRIENPFVVKLKLTKTVFFRKAAHDF